MIRILPLNEENKLTVRPFYKLVVTLGYGEHCDDTTTESWVEIDDAKAMKYAELTDEEADNMDLFELRSLANCISQKEAENIVLFFNSLWERKDKDGFEVDHIIISDGIDPFWWKECGAMTDMEFEWFSGVFDEFETTLFNPQIEHNWCGIVNVKIEYVDENGKTHKCEVI
jgi:hypothetical protein